MANPFEKIDSKLYLERLHNPNTAWTGIFTETAGNALLFVGNIFVANIRGHLPAGDGVGRAHGLTEMAVPALAAGKAAVCFTFHVGTTFDVRLVMLCGQSSQIDQLLIKRHPLFTLGLRDNKIC